jgi:hypothetical protein
MSDGLGSGQDGTVDLLGCHKGSELLQCCLGCFLPGRSWSLGIHFKLLEVRQRQQG